MSKRPDLCRADALAFNPDARRSKLENADSYFRRLRLRPNGKANKQEQTSEQSSLKPFEKLSF